MPSTIQRLFAVFILVAGYANPGHRSSRPFPRVRLESPYLQEAFDPKHAPRPPVAFVQDRRPKEKAPQTGAFGGLPDQDSNLD
jgi:hypothetical protein